MADDIFAEDVDYAEPDETPSRKRRSRQAFSFGRFVGILLIVVINFAVAVGGGVAGFVFLANSQSPAIADLRERLGIEDGDSLAVPVRQTVRLEESSIVIDAAKKVSPAVVSISASQQVADFFGTVSTQEVGGGTGFIITSDGLIVTNKHVVSNDASYKVILNDGEIYDATVQALDPLNDLAVIKIDAKDLPTVEIGDSDALEIGQNVIAIGNALGEFKNSVTSGVVSAKQRSIVTGGSYTSTDRLSDLLQTDAAINPGNSGGPLVNMAGQVVGINTAIASNTGSSVGVGFAIPINSVKSAIDSVRKTGAIERPYLGIRYVPINQTLQRLNNLPTNYGVLVMKGGSNELAVIMDSPAAKAGIVENDIITEINGERIDENHPLTDRLRKYGIGETVKVKIIRDGEERTVDVTLEKYQQ